jgi:protoporphyrinogen oxidase
VVYEAEEKAGGLAVGFKDKDWSWSLEKFYHHIFANDKDIIRLANKVGARLIFEKPVTVMLRNDRVSQLDTPMSLLLNPELSLWGRLRMAKGLSYLKLLNKRLGMGLEHRKAIEMLPKLVGQEGYDKVWEPLLVAKFGKFVGEVNMAWFWARISKRTKALGYFEKGFEELANKCVIYIQKKGGEVRLGTKVEGVKENGDGVMVGEEKFDKAILTLPAPLVDRLIGAGKVKWPEINYLWGQTLVLELEKSLMDWYWLNVLNKEFPFLVVVEHTNFMGKKFYGNRRLVYVGNYLEEGDSRLGLNEKELLELFAPYLKKVNRGFKKAWVKKLWKWQAPFAQPVFPVNYSIKVPGFETGMKSVYIANMSMVYPWDRGTNYAVELGEKVAKKMEKANI